MKKNIHLLICGISLMAGLQLLNACEQKSDVAETATEKSSGSGSLFGKSTEQKLDDFLTDYIKDLKAALAEKDDKRAAAKIQQMQQKYQSKAEDLKAELEAWESSLSEEEKKAFEERAENKPYIQDLLTTSFGAMGRINKSPELRKAFEELNSNVDFASKEMSSDETTTGEEYPEDVVEEESEESDNE